MAMIGAVGMTPAICYFGIRHSLLTGAEIQYKPQIQFDIRLDRLGNFFAAVAG
jgi:hypothetical protein